MSRISFILTIYNKSRYLEKVLQSIRNQIGDFDREYIFIDDGSTDNSIEIIEEYTSNWPNVTIIKQHNQGPSIAINKGIFLANSDFIKFVDGDDILPIDATESLLKAALASNSLVAYGIFGAYNITDDLEKISLSSASSARTIQEALKLIVSGKSLGISAIGASIGLVSTKLAKEIKGADERVFVQDFSIALRCAFKTDKFVFVNKVVALVPSGYANEHLSSNKELEYHDTLLALYHFLNDNQSKLKDYNIYFYRRLRKILWQRQLKIHGAKAYFGDEFKSYLFSKLNFYLPTILELLYQYKKALNKFDPSKIRNTIHYKL